MANKKGLIVDCEKKPSFEFSASFKKSFDALIDAYSKALAKLNKVSTGKDFKSAYGVCSCSYKLRYITPNDVSTYVSNLIKGLESGLFKDRVGDVELFTVASVKRFIEDNGCPAFEDSTAIDEANNYVNPKEQTLHDLACLCENDIGNVAVYSNGEMVKRLDLMKEDVAKMNDMHFAANLKKIVNAMPDVLKKGDCWILGNKAYMLTFETFLQDFILFVCTINIIGVLQLISYATPDVEYDVKEDEKTKKVVTECCLINTTNYMARTKIPFNCNMRDVVLQDVTPDFKDVHDAMHFIMKDPRSPISVLVNKYASKEEIRDHMDGDFIGRMFIGSNFKGWCGDYYKKDGKMTDSPRNVDNFDTDVDWLDTIAFGNNYLDGNYRRDAVGNNKVHPIMNTLDMIYRIFGNCELKTNEELANNMVRVAGTMRSIVHAYRGGEPIENYDLTKDVLAVLGEIFTRNMLRLFYNNTRTFTYEDDMPDACAPGFICMEEFTMDDVDLSFIMENGEQQQGQQGQQQTAVQQGNAKSGVTFTNKQGQQASPSGGPMKLITKLLDWIKNQLAKFSGNFAKRYKAYSDYVQKNAKTNDAIKAAIAAGNFIPNLTNIPAYQLNKERHIGMPKEKIISELLDPSKEYNAAKGTFQILLNDKNDVINDIMSAQNNAQGDDNAKGKAGIEVTLNYFLYGKTKPEMINGKMTDTFWDELVDELKNCIPFVDEATKAFTKTSTDAAEAVKAKAMEAQQNNNNDLSARCDQVSKSLGNLENIQRSVLIEYGTKFFQGRYNLYRDIVNGFNQQNNNTNTDQPAQPAQPAEPANQPPQNGDQANAGGNNNV